MQTRQEAQITIVNANDTGEPDPVHMVTISVQPGDSLIPDQWFKDIADLLADPANLPSSLTWTTTTIASIDVQDLPRNVTPNS